ncbi:MAG: DUF4159 domain-containing protein [Maricaulaceae bacterium]
MSFGGLTFLAPLSLLGLLLLPIIWWILRTTPPQPKKAVFPPLRILQDVMSEEETPDSTPWWLLIFRVFIGALLAVALASPILGSKTDETNRPLTLVIDDSWDAAPNWSGVVREAEARIAIAQRANLNVALITTTEPTETPAFLPASQAMDQVKALFPKALPANHMKTAKAISALDITRSDAVWLSGGYDFGEAGLIAENLRGAANASILTPLPDRRAVIPGKVSETGSGFRSVWHNPYQDQRSVSITAHDSGGSVIARSDLNFVSGNPIAEAEFDLPADLRSRVSRLRAEGLTSAGTVKLLDDSWGRPVVGILTTGKDETSPLLSEPFYANTALEPHADIFMGTLDELLPLAPSILVMPDVARTQEDALVSFVEAGGLLIRFAGPKLAARADDLLPVLLRKGDRALGGALTWQDPQGLATFPQDSPFFGLGIPNDITVRQQVMAQPGAETDARTWARLADGAPIVTSAPRGLGRVVLFHITASPEWSNLAVSGLYVDMLRRILPLAGNRPAKTVQDTSGDWTAERVLTGYGRLSAPDIRAKSLPDDAFDTVRITAEHPPGFYRQGARRRALQTVSEPENIKPLPSFAGLQQLEYGHTKRRTLGGILLGFALSLFVLDVIFSIWLSGRFRYLIPKRAPKFASVFIGASLVAATLITPQTARADEMPTLMEDALSLHLAYIKTGNSTVDDLSRAAMETLVRELTGRTTIEPAGVRGVNPENDALVFYPFLYYPVSRDAEALSDAASQALNAYMASGGTIVFDTRDQGDRALLGTNQHPGLMAVTAKLDMPQITQIDKDHVLTKSFYLMQRFPGRWANGPVWVEKDRNGSARDGVSSVIIGSNDWAAGWAMTENRQGLIDLENDMSRQREYALRFGVNLAMYALSGNYKSDQVHAAELIRRIGGPKAEPRNIKTAPTPEDMEKPEFQMPGDKP